MTMLHPSGAHARAPFSASSSEPVLDYLVDLGVTAIELLPVQAFVNDRFLVASGLTNYWGYQTARFLRARAAIPARGHPSPNSRHMVARFHAAGIEVLMDVVYNHTGEGSELGPTLCFPRSRQSVSYYRLER
jgi:isoamylase